MLRKFVVLLILLMHLGSFHSRAESLYTDCAPLKSLTEEAMQKSQGLPEFTSDLFRKSDIVMIGESHFEKFAAPYFKMVVQNLKKHSNSCLLLERDHMGVNQCISGGKWRTKQSSPACHEGQMAAAQEAWQSGVPIYNIDIGVSTCGGHGIDQKEFLASLTCRDQKMAQEIKNLFVSKKCSKAAMLVGSKHLFQKGDGREDNLLKFAKKQMSQLKINACLLAQPDETDPDRSLYPKNGDSAACSEVPEPVGRSLAVDLSSLASRRNFMMGSTYSDNTHFSWEDPNCLIYLGCQDPNLLDCKAQKSPKFSNRPIFYKVKLPSSARPENSSSLEDIAQ